MPNVIIRSGGLFFKSDNILYDFMIIVFRIEYTKGDVSLPVIITFGKEYMKLYFFHKTKIGLCPHCLYITYNSLEL